MGYYGPGVYPHLHVVGIFAGDVTSGFGGDSVTNVTPMMSYFALSCLFRNTTEAGFGTIGKYVALFHHVLYWLDSLF